MLPDRCPMTVIDMILCDNCHCYRPKDWDACGCGETVPTVEKSEDA